MSYYLGLPDDATNFNIGIISSATPGTQTTGTLLAAPGASFRYRLWAIYIGPFDTSQAAVNPVWTADIGNIPFTSSYARIARNNWWSGEIYWPGGFPYAANVGIGYALVATIASLAIGFTGIYTTEPIT